MHTNRFLRLRSILATTPSRRDATRCLVGLTASSLLAPLLGGNGAKARKKHKKKKKLTKKQFCKKAYGGPVCNKSKSGCCYKGKVCTNTSCGCMESGSTNCCVTSKPDPANPGGYPCPDDHECCPGKDYDYFPCCPPGTTCCGGDFCCDDRYQTCCGGVCCPSYKCCGDTCCPLYHDCCPDGQCRISC